MPDSLKAYNDILNPHRKALTDEITEYVNAFSIELPHRFSNIERCILPSIMMACAVESPFNSRPKAFNLVRMDLHIINYLSLSVTTW